MNENKTALEKAQTTWEQDLQAFKKIPAHQKVINRKYDEAMAATENFTDEMNSVELDKFLQEQFLNTEENIADGVTLEGSYSVSDEDSSSIGYYYYLPNPVTYALYEQADMDGSIGAAYTTENAIPLLLEEKTEQDVGSGSSEFTVIINRKDTMALLDAVHKYAEDNKDAMIINSVSVEEYQQFNEAVAAAAAQPSQPGGAGGAGAEGGEGGAGAEGAAGGENGGEEGGETERPGFTSVTISYTVYYIQEPTKPDIGPEYDENIWNGEEWKTYAGTGTATTTAE